MDHYPGHLVMGAAALALTLAVQSVTLNRHIRRKLRLSLALLGAYVLVNAVFAVVTPAWFRIADEDTLRGVERLALAAALINLLVMSLVNPLRVDRVPERFPTIVQDFLVIGLVVLAGTMLSEQLIATSAIGAVVVGFALQDTLGNAFAGLAIQSEAPFRIGNWIRVGEFEGRVAEMTWRATKLRTKSGNFVVVPNSKIAEEAIVNFSEPAVPTRLEVEVGASYSAAPNDVVAAAVEAIRQVPRVLEAPAPDALLVRFDDSAITYRARFWVSDYEWDDEIRDDVRTAIYYAFARHGIEIPWPIEVVYQRESPDPSVELEARQRLVESVPLFSNLADEQRRELARSAAFRTYGAGEAVVREGEPGSSLFILCKGRVSVTLQGGRDLASIEQGGYFGEMSLLTGEPRTATVSARDGDVVVLELTADAFRALAASDPAAVEQVGLAAAARRVELDDAKRAAPGAVAVEAPATLLARMRRFLRF